MTMGSVIINVDSKFCVSGDVTVRIWFVFLEVIVGSEELGKKGVELLFGLGFGPIW